MSSLAIIIPVYNEYTYLSLHLERLLYCLQQDSSVGTILFVDGGSSDNTVALLRQHDCTIISSPKGRAVQLNIGAREVMEEYVLFLFCDCLPEQGFGAGIISALQHKHAGCMTFRYDSDAWYLRLFSWFASKKIFLRHKFGDSGIFFRREIFLEQGGFDETNILEHDNAFINKMLDVRQFQQIPCILNVSPRIFEHNSFIVYSMVCIIVHIGYHLGISQKRLMRLYKKVLS